LSKSLPRLARSHFALRKFGIGFTCVVPKSFAEMTNISKDLREKLEQNFSIARQEISKDFISLDGTRKMFGEDV
jgi:adenine C2-methylase RlmN of 23S rRNA A2503 and tRNA A37